ncbi:hypothetical protein [Nonomuraea harbinensis]|uniref:Bacterial Ig-like domain-containing protein n=1 Tax=Nonomuraea harbinensis TaxID=1286938 RepID=A0ABW1BXB6_9ACTN|nr:hypothetical protein [Nonomuraea harbinensis]
MCGEELRARSFETGKLTYFGWPTSSELPWTFSDDGTVIDHLVFGKLPRGLHTVEYRSIDAAGNHGAPGEFTVTTITGEHRGPLAVTGTLTASEAAAVLLTGNDAPVLSGSTVGGALACTGNTPAPADLGVPNALRGAGAGQRRELRDGAGGERYEAVQHLGE